MATSTTNLGLTKPSVNDAADIGVLNSNFDKIDTKCNPALFAPSGYGLGAHGIYCSDCNSATKNGWYRFDASTLNIAPSASQGSLFVRNAESSSGVIVYQTMWNGYWRAYRFYGPWNNTWTEWESENPPMQLGVEYRTTEKWNGKSVYAKLLDAGYLPNASSKVLNGVIQSGIDELVALECTCSGGWTKKTHDPRIDLTMGVEQPYAWVTITTTADLSAYIGRVLIKWTRPD